MENTDCRSYRKNYGRFLNGKLEGKERRLLMKHVEECAECREELRIQYLLQEGMFRLEHGGTFDINSDFERMLVDVQKEIKQESRRTMFFRTAMIVFLGVAYYFIGIGIVNRDSVQIYNRRSICHMKNMPRLAVNFSARHGKS